MGLSSHRSASASWNPFSCLVDEGAHLEDFDADDHRNSCAKSRHARVDPLACSTDLGDPDRPRAAHNIAIPRPQKRSRQKSEPNPSNVPARRQGAAPCPSKVENKAVLDHGQSWRLMGQGKKQPRTKNTKLKQTGEGRSADETGNTLCVQTEVWKPDLAWMPKASSGPLKNRTAISLLKSRPKLQALRGSHQVLTTPSKSHPRRAPRTRPGQTFTLFRKLPKEVQTMIWNFAANDLDIGGRIYSLWIESEDAYSYYCYWLQYSVMLDYQPKACTPEAKQLALELYHSQPKAKGRQGWEGDYNAFLAEVDSPSFSYFEAPSINRGWFPEMLSVSNDVRNDLMPDYLRLLHDSVGDYRLIAHLQTSIFCIELAERRLMDPKQLQAEIKRRKSQVSSNQLASGFGHKVGLDLATDLAKTIAPPSGSFCPCLLRLLQNIKRGALMLAIIPYGYDTTALEGLNYFRTAWAEVAVPEFMDYVKQYVLPYMPKLKTLQLVVPENNNSYNRWGHERRNLGRRQGGWPWSRKYVALEAKLADIERKIQSIKAENLSPNAEVEFIKQLQLKEWRLVHDADILQIIATVLQRWKGDIPSVEVKLELAIEEYSASYAYMRLHDYRPAKIGKV